MVEYLLQLYKHDDYPSYLLKAIDVAAVLLNVHSTMATMVSRDIAIDLYTRVEVEFQEDPHGAYAWTYSNERKVIYVNRVLADRLELLKKRDKTRTNEFDSLVLMLAHVLVHGCANLMGKWLDPTVSSKCMWIVPPSIKKLRAEADRVFKGRCRLLIQKPRAAEPHAWTKTMPVNGIVVQREASDIGIDAKALRAFLAAAPGNKDALWRLVESDSGSFPALKPVPLKRASGQVIHLDIRDPATAPQSQVPPASAVAVADGSDRPKKQQRRR